MSNQREEREQMAIVSISNNNKSETIERYKVKLLSYNVFMRPPLIKNNETDEKKRRLKKILEATKDYSILALQELFGTFSPRQRKFLEKAKQKGFIYYAKGPCHFRFPSKRIVDSGLVILSKFPILEKDFVEFKKSISSDSLAAKGCLYASIHISQNPFFKIHLFNVHLQASYHDKKSEKKKAEFEKVRKTQLIQVKEFIDRKTKDDEFPILLVGDFNINGFRNSSQKEEDSEEYLWMKDLFSKSYIVVDHIKDKYGFHPPTVGDVIENEDGTIIPKEVILTHPNDQLRTKRLDYIFSLKRKNEVPNQNWKYLQDSSLVEPFFVDQEDDERITQLSDHYGVSAQFLYN